MNFSSGETLIISVENIYKSIGTNKVVPLPWKGAMTLSVTTPSITEHSVLTI